MPDIQPLGGEPPIASRFLLEVDDVEIGVFRSVSGLQLSIDAEDVTEGGENGFVHKLPGRMTWPNLVFKRGITDNNALFEWISKTSGEGFAANSDRLVRHTGAVTVVAHDGTRLRSWSLNAIFPVRWSGPNFDSDSNTPLEEELEVTHHGLTARTP